MKKTISLMLSVVLLVTSAFPAFANTPVFVIKPGDLNEDERVTTADARAALRAAIGIDTLSAYQLWLADLNGSGGVDTGDARAILRIAVGLDALPALPEHADHVWNEGVVTVAPGCETAGERMYTCSVCGETRTETLPSKGGHQWNDGEVTVAPGCETEGEKSFTCTVCGETRTETVPAVGHAWELFEVITFPTWQRNGMGTYRCSVCGIEKTMSIPVTGEDREDDRADRLLAFMKAHGETDGSVTVYRFTVSDAVYKLSFDEATPENGFLYTFDHSEKVSFGEFGSNTYSDYSSLTLLPPFSSFEGTTRFKIDKLTYLECTFTIPDPARFRTQNQVLGLEISVIKNNVGLSESAILEEVGTGLQSFLYALEENLKENEADFSVYTDLGFAHLDEWKPE